jgi:indolepyruvate ferredoxin oxidoreductase beta subunit
MKSINFLLAGVGGQGTLLASSVLAEVGWRAGYDVKKAEAHGMSQRGGSVTSHVRWGAEVHSPLIGAGEVDVLLVFEKVEALRSLAMLRPGGTLIVNDQAIEPISVTSGGAAYPDDAHLRQVVAGVTDDVSWVPGVQIAEELGDSRAANLVLLGALSARLDVPAELWLAVIAERVPAKSLALNCQAFERGRQHGPLTTTRPSSETLRRT